MGLVNNWALGLDAQGRPKRNPEKDETVAGSLVNGDVTNYPPASFSPDTGLFYVYENNSLCISYLVDPDPRGSTGPGGTMNGRGLSYGSFLDAIRQMASRCGTRVSVQAATPLRPICSMVISTSWQPAVISYLRLF
jgi:hypothetical protein